MDTKRLVKPGLGKLDAGFEAEGDGNGAERLPRYCSTVQAVRPFRNPGMPSQIGKGKIQDSLFVEEWEGAGIWEQMQY